MIGQLAAQDETNKIIMGALSGLQQSIEMIGNRFKLEAPKLEAPKLEAPKSPPSIQKNPMYTALAGKVVGNISVDNNDVVGHYGLGKLSALHHQNRLQEIFLDQYQRSRESMESVRAENNMISSLSKIQQLTFHM